ncbi:Actin-like protein 10 [Didymella keratinophila]|nr:Actin-like protein 10 [Didymella keratinophila]
MDDALPVAPGVTDHYHDLIVSQHASTADIKKAPGKVVDAAEFRRIQEAYETLVNNSSRADYDASYWILQYQWQRYREDPERWKRDEPERMRPAEEEAAEKKISKEEAAAKLAEAKSAAKEFRRRVEEQRRAEQKKKRLAEAPKKAEAEWSSELAQELKRQRAEQGEEKRVRAAWAKRHANTMHSAFLRAARSKGHRQTSLLEGHFVELGWQENAGSAQCELCGIVTKRHHLVCPVSSAVGCDDCMTILSLSKQPTSVNSEAATPQWSYASKDKGRKSAPATPKAVGAPQTPSSKWKLPYLKINLGPKRPQATSAAGNNDPQKDIPKSRPRTTSSGKAKIKRIFQAKETKAKATATHATPRMPQPQLLSKLAIQIKEIKTQTSAVHAVSTRPRRPVTAGGWNQKGAVCGPAHIDWELIQFLLLGLQLCLLVLNSIRYGPIRASEARFA